MRIHEIWIRFYKSFNFDYELKATPGAKKRPWQEIEEVWIPHVRIPIEPDVTSVVGANESGKSHLLGAIKIVLTGENLLQRDFCRSSSLFSVERDSRRYPEVGATFRLDEVDQARLQELEIPLFKNDDLLMLRPAPKRIEVVNAEDERVNLTENQVKDLEELLPYPYELQTSIPLPDSVPISTLAQSETTIASRKKRVRLLSSLVNFNSADDIKNNASNLFTLVTEATEEESEAQRLGMDLLTKVAHIEESIFEDLSEAITNEREGFVNGLIKEMNNAIARHLNVSRWWSQDSEFQLQVSPREHELVFTIRDRTGTDYSFTERSRGLTYFLGYYVQLLSHDRSDTRPEVLLMDEPDAYLSASGQQDLLRVLEYYSRPDDSDSESQVIYVTHSPFLINRNAGHRVRVLDKGSRDEGTRVVRDATRNHYEPLRTSLGEFVAETAFIGGENLFVEGIADQVLLAGMNTRLVNNGTPPSQCLDLNQVTIVPGGSNIPYMLYLARGRDKVKPACAVLLDGDAAGKTAQKQIEHGGALRKPIVASNFVVMLSDWAEKAELKVTDGVDVHEIEDLVPVKVAVAACQHYAKTFLGLDNDKSKDLKESAVTRRLSENDGKLWDSLKEAFTETFNSSLSKAGFAKELLAYLDESKAESRNGSRAAGVPALEQNFAALIYYLANTLRTARDSESDDRRDQRLERIIEGFISDYPNGCIGDTASLALGRIDKAVDDTPFGDIIRNSTIRLRREFKLDTEPLSIVDDYPEFLQALKDLRHAERLYHQGAIDASGGGAARK